MHVSITGGPGREIDLFAVQDWKTMAGNLEEEFVSVGQTGVCVYHGSKFRWEDVVRDHFVVEQGRVSSAEKVTVAFRTHAVVLSSKRVGIQNRDARVVAPGFQLLHEYTDAGRFCRSKLETFLIRERFQSS